MPSLPTALILGAHIVFAVIVLAPAFTALFTGVASPLSKQRAWIATILLLTTGLQNFMTRMSAGIPKEYHMVFGIKFLLALHVIAITIVLTQPKDEAKRLSLLKGVAISGVVVVFLGAYLGYLAGQPRI